MMRPCPNCPNGAMEGETQQIPKQILLPIIHAMAIPFESYLPFIMRKYHNYTVYICTTWLHGSVLVMKKSMDFLQIPLFLLLFSRMDQKENHCLRTV
jgi:hypothetical protein